MNRFWPTRLWRTRLWPTSLTGQMLVILLAGLMLSHAVGALFYAADREQAVRAVGGFSAAQRIANLARLVGETSAAQRPRLVAALSDERFRVTLAATPPLAASPEAPVARVIADYLAAELGLSGERLPRVAVAAPINAEPEPHPRGRFGPHHGPMRHGAGGRGSGAGAYGGHAPMYQGFSGLGGFSNLTLAIPLPDGPWLVFGTALPESGPGYSMQFILSMAVMALIIGLATVLAARRVTAPLAALARAAERLGRDMNAPPVAETGSAETKRAAQAFNEMQRRLRSFIDSRTRLLAAISHDLRTPLTLLRLRAEGVENSGERERMLATIAEMDAMLGAALEAARDEAAAEPMRPADLTALLESCVDDRADAGLDVTMAPSAAVVAECQPAALRRAVGNLIDNALKYGRTARVALQDTAAAVTITVEDDGLGIPPEELARVFEPFYRVEGSRSRGTGGVGLGLAITRSLVAGMGGSVALANRPPGGLVATITLPR